MAAAGSPMEAARKLATERACWGASRFGGRYFIHWDSNRYFEGEYEGGRFLCHDGDQRKVTQDMLHAVGEPCQEGDHVLAYWSKKHTYACPGRLMSMGPAVSFVQFDDGDKGEVPNLWIHGYQCMQGSRFGGQKIINWDGKRFFEGVFDGSTFTCHDKDSRAATTNELYAIGLPFSERDRVLAYLTDKHKYLKPGVAAGVGKEKSSVEFDDGDTAGIPNHWITYAPEKKLPHGVPRFGGSCLIRWDPTRYFEGTYDGNTFLAHDGDKRNVEEGELVAIGEPYEEGDRVAAYYTNKHKWLNPGKVTIVGPSYSYVVFDDGDKAHLPNGSIHKAAPKPPSIASGVACIVTKNVDLFESPTSTEKVGQLRLLQKVVAGEVATGEAGRWLAVEGHGGYVEAGALAMHPSAAERLDWLGKWFGRRCEITKTEHRAVTIPQLQKVISFASSSCHRWFETSERSTHPGGKLSMPVLNLYMLTAWFIGPATERDNCACVELLAHGPQPPRWFVSHWWGELVDEFLACLYRHREVRGGTNSDAYWVCAYANRQHDLKAEVTDDPTQTSFFRAMHIAVGIVLVLDGPHQLPDGSFAGPATPFSRIWCAFEEFTGLASDTGRGEPMLFDIATVSDGHVQILTDGVADEDERRASWQNPALVAKTQREQAFPIEVIDTGLKTLIHKASASYESDRVHILNSIAGTPLDAPPPDSHPKYDEVNRKLNAIFATRAWSIALKKGKVRKMDLPSIVKRDSWRKSLSFALTDATDVDIEDVAESFSENVEELKLFLHKNNRLTDQGLAALGLRLPVKLKVFVIDLFGVTSITDSGVAALVQHLPGGLTELDLRLCATGISSQACAAIARALPATLECLAINLASDPVSDGGLAAIAKALPPGLKTLTILFQSTEVCDSGLAALGAGLPGGLQKLSINMGSLRGVSAAGMVSLGRRVPKTLKNLCVLPASIGSVVCDPEAQQDLPRGLPRFKGQYLIHWDRNRYFEGTYDGKTFTAHDGDKRDVEMDALCAIGSPFRESDRVLAYHTDKHKYLNPGWVTWVGKEKSYVEFDDGDKAELRNSWVHKIHPASSAGDDGATVQPAAPEEKVPVPAKPISP